MDIKQLVRIKTISTDDHDSLLAFQLAEALGLAPPDAGLADAPFYFTYQLGRLELYESIDTRHRAPLCVDFCSGPTYYRYLRDRRINQPLCKAVGIRKGFRPNVCDATAGLGEDGFVLASLGCRVVMIERSPIVWALLDDGIRRATNHPVIGELMSGRISLYRADSATFLQDSGQRFDAIYLDPMYPPNSRSALNKKKMRLLRHLVGSDDDCSELLNIARHKTAARIAVKRPLRAPALSPVPPDFSIFGKSSRFDVYLPSHL